jgi:hypothetical protein
MKYLGRRTSDMFPQNVSWLPPDFMALYPRRQNSSKVKLSVCLRIVPREGVKAVLCEFLISTLDGNEWSASRFHCLNFPGNLSKPIYRVNILLLDMLFRFVSSVARHTPTILPIVRPLPCELQWTLSNCSFLPSPVVASSLLRSYLPFTEHCPPP